jgi:hypothetical protein
VTVSSPLLIFIYNRTNKYRRTMLDTMEPTSASATMLSKADRCDTGNCPAQAWVLVKFLSGELTFCSHHFDKYEASLIKDAYEVIDERHLINQRSESSA